MLLAAAFGGIGTLIQAQRIGVRLGAVVLSHLVAIQVAYPFRAAGVCARALGPGRGGWGGRWFVLSSLGRQRRVGIDMYGSLRTLRGSPAGRNAVYPHVDRGIDDDGDGNDGYFARVGFYKLADGLQ